MAPRCASGCCFIPKLEASATLGDMILLHVKAPLSFVLSVSARGDGRGGSSFLWINIIDQGY